MKKQLPTDSARNSLLLRVSIGLAVAVVAMKIHAEVTIGFASLQGGVNQQSDGAPIDTSFTFQLGTFANSFVPTSSNTDQWLNNWVVVQDSGGAPLSGATAPYGPQSGFFGGTYDGFKGEITLDHNNLPFNSGSQGYVWGYDNQLGTGEWVLMTNGPGDPGADWIYPSVAGVTPTESWTVGTAGDAIVGAINFTDDKGDDISIETALVGGPPVVPEPSTGLFLISAIAFLGSRRRRPRR